MTPPLTSGAPACHHGIVDDGSGRPRLRTSRLAFLAWGLLMFGMAAILVSRVAPPLFEGTGLGRLVPLRPSEREFIRAALWAALLAPIFALAALARIHHAPASVGGKRLAWGALALSAVFWVVGLCPYLSRSHDRTPYTDANSLCRYLLDAQQDYRLQDVNRGGPGLYADSLRDLLDPDGDGSRSDCIFVDDEYLRMLETGEMAGWYVEIVPAIGSGGQSLGFSQGFAILFWPADARSGLRPVYMDQRGWFCQGDEVPAPYRDPHRRPPPLEK